MSGPLDEVRLALRGLRRQPAVAAMIVATLALGIGPATALFTVVDGVLLRPLPYADAERIVAVTQFEREAPTEQGELSPANFLDLRDRSRLFETVAAADAHALDYAGTEGPETIPIWRVSEGFFDVLRTPARLGRSLRRGDHQAGQDRVVVLSDGLWRERFGGDPGAVGRKVTLDGQPYTIVGVMPPEFRYPTGAGRLWAPRVLTEEDRRENDAFLTMVGRLRPGVTPDQAGAELRALAGQLAAERPRSNGGVGFRPVPLADALVGEARTGLFVLLGAAALVLLIACANVANLVLARALGREREMAIRVALGASRGRIGRLVAAESLLLSVLGGMLGVAVTWLCVRAIPAFSPPDIPRLDQVRLDGRALAAALLLTLGTALLCGAAPALRFSRVDLSGSLKEGGPGTAGAGVRRRRLRGALVAGEVALAMVLLVGAGLLARSFVELLRVDRGFRSDNVLAVTLFSWQWYPREGERAVFAREVLQRLREVPGVRSAGATSSLPMAESIANDQVTFAVEGRPVGEGEEPTAHRAIVTDGYFETMGIALRRGRLFQAADDDRAEPVVVVNETMARRFFPGEDPVGRRVRLVGRSTRVATVVGVVADVRQESLLTDPPASIYLPHAQSPTGSLVFAVRAGGDPLPLLGPVKEALWSVNPAIPLYSATTLDELLAAQVREQRFHMLLLGVFAVAALLLAGVGIYGALAQRVGEDVHAIAVRMAMGARRRDVVGLVMRSGLLLAAAGVAVGVAAAATLARVIRGMLFGVAPLDPAAYATGGVVVLALAALACYLPARRAAALSPMAALKRE